MKRIAILSCAVMILLTAHAHANSKHHSQAKPNTIPDADHYAHHDWPGQLSRQLQYADGVALPR